MFLSFICQHITSLHRTGLGTCWVILQEQVIFFPPRAFAQALPPPGVPFWPFSLWQRGDLSWPWGRIRSCHSCWRLHSQGAFALYPALIAQLVKNLLAVQETCVGSLGWEDLLDEGNGNPLQYSCLENPKDRETWKATVCGVARVRYDLVTKPPPHSDFSWMYLLPQL